MFDAEKIYKKEIEKHINEIKNICVINKIPMFFTAGIRDNEKTTDYVTEAVMPNSNGIELKDDRITKMLAVMNGFDVVPQYKMDVLDMEELDLE